jgi:hypothetical protein
MNNLINFIHELGNKQLVDKAFNFESVVRLSGLVATANAFVFVDSFLSQLSRWTESGEEKKIDVCSRNVLVEP